ncbi:MAG: pyridoxal-phosphate dependent enzyme [Myxococcota bacterium]
MQEMRLSINPHVALARCSRTGRDQNADWNAPLGLCGCCGPPGSPVVLEYDLPAIEATGAALFEAAPGPGIWRFAALLPVHGVTPSYAADVGRTPTVLHERLGDELQVELWLKGEAANPSGSFKDRGLAVGIALGCALGAERFCLPTQGSAGVAAALFSARLGLPACLVYMPDSQRGSVYHRGALHFGAEVRFAGSNIAEAGAAMRRECAAELESGARSDISTFFEPGRLEGKKTLGLEIFEHFGASGLPELILYPTGGGTGLVGIWKALRELCELGRIDAELQRLPRMIAVQSERCAPVVDAFERGLEQVEPVVSRGTIADGLDVPAAIMGHAILASLRESGGSAVRVSDEEIERDYAACGRAGIPAGYESAATLSALRQLLASGDLRRGARVLALLTGSQLVALGAAGASAQSP